MEQETLDTIKSYLSDLEILAFKLDRTLDEAIQAKQDLFRVTAGLIESLKGVIEKE